MPYSDASVYMINSREKYGYYRIDLVVKYGFAVCLNVFI